MKKHALGTASSAPIRPADPFQAAVDVGLQSKPKEPAHSKPTRDAGTAVAQPGAAAGGAGGHVRVGLYMPRELWDKVRALSFWTGESVTGIVAEAVARDLLRHEPIKPMPAQIKKLRRRG